MTPIRALVSADHPVELRFEFRRRLRTLLSSNSMECFGMSPDWRSGSSRERAYHEAGSHPLCQEPELGGGEVALLDELACNDFDHIRALAQKL